MNAEVLDYIEKIYKCGAFVTEDGSKLDANQQIYEDMVVTISE